MNEILSLDSALLSPADQSFFNEDCLSKQHSSDITSLASDDWLQNFEDIRSFCDGLELNLNYEPELTLEAMAKEVDTQYQPKAYEVVEYLDSTAFLSPQSIEPTSPQTFDANPVEYDSDMTFLEELLSANSSDSESLSDQCYDSELTVQCITEVSKDSNEDITEDSILIEEKPSPQTRSAPKRQYKRKAQANDSSAKPSKRSKTTATERRERKRTQNKSAANRYRQKKRAELDGIEQEQDTYVEVNNKLKEQLEKLQMEFRVVYPLAKAAFASDPSKALQLQMLDIRLLSNNLLE